MNQFTPKYSAPPHNDSVYSLKMEETFGLMCIHPAREGGLTKITCNKSILAELNQTADSRSVVKRLREEHFPFAIPTAFMGKESSPDTDVVVAPVLEGENATRFRLDLIQTGFDQMPELWTSAKEWAVQRFYELATCGRHTLTLQLNSGDILFGHNRNILRARTPFDDAQRLLIRIRMSRANTP